MARINYRLSEWLKRVDKSEADYINRKTKGSREQDAKPEEPAVDEAANSQTAEAEVVSKPRAVPVSKQASDTDTPGSTTEYVRRADRVRPTTPPEPEPTPTLEGDPDEISLATEGTGAPRPLSTRPDTSATVAPEVPKTKKEAPAGGDTRPQKRKTNAPVVQEKEADSDKHIHSAEEPTPDIAKIKENWSRLPHHLQVLFSTPESEVAQRSYKTFKDTREELIARLLDPTLTLEDTARILNVCPTTVRRYTNRDLLKHYRTAGNQRRFRLSDVLSFMETNSKNGLKGTRRRKSQREE